MTQQKPTHIPTVAEKIGAPLWQPMPDLDSPTSPHAPDSEEKNEKLDETESSGTKND